MYIYLFDIGAMTIGPKKKISQSQGAKRHSTRQKRTMKKLQHKYAVAKCSHCGALKIAHRVCGACGWYGKKQVLTIKVKDRSTIVDA